MTNERALEYCLRYTEARDGSVLVPYELLRTCAEALDKQIPKKPTLYDDGRFRYYKCQCGDCLAFRDEVPGLPYCLSCGQAIDWSSDEES